MSTLEYCLMAIELLLRGLPLGVHRTSAILRVRGFSGGNEKDHRW